MCSLGRVDRILPLIDAVTIYTWLSIIVGGIMPLNDPYLSDRVTWLVDSCGFT